MAMEIERNHYLIIPAAEDQRVICEKVEKACRNKLIADYKIRLNAGYTTTITCVYVEAMIKVLVQLMRENHGEAAVNFMDLMTISSSNRENDYADKDGNINIRFIPGMICDGIMERDYAPIIVEEMWADDVVMKAIERECSHILAIKHKISTSNVKNYTKIAFCYLEYLFRTLKLMARVAKDNGHAAAMLNFLEMFEAHATIETVQNPDNPDLESEKITLKLRPGFQAKLLIKDDGITESDDAEDDD